MNRRQLLQALGASTLLYLPWRARAGGNPPYKGPLLLHIHARGGWDTSMLCDAKAENPGYKRDDLDNLVLDSQGNQIIVFENNYVTKTQVENGIRVPAATKGPNPLYYYSYSSLGAAKQAIESPLTFFQEFGDRFVAINGVDTETILHSAGIQQVMAGDSGHPLPSLAALMAGRDEASVMLPAAFIAGGVYNATGGVVSVSRLGGALPSVADTFKVGISDGGEDLLSAAEIGRMRTARLERAQELQGQLSSAREARSLKSYQEALQGNEVVAELKSALSTAGALSELDLAAWEAAIPGFVNDVTRPFYNTPDRQDVVADLERILQCFASGLSIAANFESGISGGFPTFDTHGAHNLNQPLAMGVLIARLRYVMVRAKQLGIDNRLHLVVTSDFARTPRYQGSDYKTQGKDHWTISSFLVSAPGLKGGRVVGGTDNGLRAVLVCASDLTKPSLTVAQLAKRLGSEAEASKTKRYVDPDTGLIYVRLRTSHVHRALRKVLQIPQNLQSEFPLPYDKEGLANLLD